MVIFAYKKTVTLKNRHSKQLTTQEHLEGHIDERYEHQARYEAVPVEFDGAVRMPDHPVSFQLPLPLQQQVLPAPYELSAAVMPLARQHRPSDSAERTPPETRGRRHI